MSVDQEVFSETRVAALQIVARLHENTGVDLLALFDDEALPSREKIRRARTELFHALCERGGFDEAAFDMNAVDVEPNLFLDYFEGMRAAGLTGPAVLQYVSTLTSRMEQMAQAPSPESLAKLIAEAGLSSIGAAMLGETVLALCAGQTLGAALCTAITRMGMGTAIGAIVAILAALIYWLTAMNPKKLLGLIINATPSALVVRNWRAGVDGGRGGDLFMAHGSMPSFMQDYEAGKLSQLVQINARYDLDETGARFCPAGLFFADKNFGFYGAEGIMVLSATDNTFQLAHMFAVPYSRDNGTNVAFLSGAPPDLESLYRELYDQRGTRRDAMFNKTHFALSTVNDARGGTVGCIAYIGSYVSERS
ncbi:MAG TPA: hypothetical protein VM733_20505 [Thermoanaerobaculia bacterium]|nr:hypothetical protein [Thermoanaerobaculia bacterium]